MTMSGLGHLVQPGCGRDVYGGVGRDSVEVFRDDDVVPGLHPECRFNDLEPGQHLQRSDEIQRG